MRDYEINRIIDNEWMREKRILLKVFIVVGMIGLAFNSLDKEVMKKCSPEDDIYKLESAEVEVEEATAEIENREIKVVETKGLNSVIRDKHKDSVEEIIEDYEWYMNTSYMSLKDVDLLARIINAEAGNQSDWCQQMVGISVLNRVESEEYPDTLYRVIYQSIGGVYQFSPVADGRIDGKPSERAYNNAKKVLEGDVTWINGLIAFESTEEGDVHSDWADKYCVEGDMTFYKEK